MDAEVTESRVMRSNYIFNVLDGGLFGLSLGFASFTTLIPLFVSQLTHSAVLIGLIPAIQSVGWQVPQLLTAGHVSRMERFKPAVMLATLHERFPFFALAAIAWFLPQMDKNVSLLLIYGTLIWFSLGGGFTANPWLNMLGKIFPGNILGTFLGFQSSALSLTGSLGAFLAGFLLQANPGNRGFFYCFLAAGATSILSFIALNQTKEESKPCLPNEAQDISILKSTLRILRTDIPFRWFLITRVFAQFCAMAFTFYTLYAVRFLGANDVMAGVLTSVFFIAQVIANPVLGLISDRIGRLFALEVGAVAGLCSAVIAFTAKTSYWMIPALILAGIANTAFFTVAMAYSLEFSDDTERPTYVGMANTLVAPATIVAPLLGGWLADSVGFSATFIAAASAGFLTFLSYLTLGKRKGRKVPA